MTPSIHLHLGFLCSQSLLLLLPKDKKLVQSSSMEQPIAGHQVHFSLLAVEVLQQSWFGYLATYAQKVVNLFNSFEGLLPEVHLDGALQLLKPNVHQILHSLWLIKLERMVLFLVLLGL